MAKLNINLDITALIKFFKYLGNRVRQNLNKAEEGGYEGVSDFFVPLSSKHCTDHRLHTEVV